MTKTALEAAWDAAIQAAADKIRPLLVQQDDDDPPHPGEARTE